MSDPVISIENLSKRYVLGHLADGKDGLRHALENVLRNPLRWMLERKRRRQSTRDEFWALKNISLEVNKGDVVGVIGRNGAGKSTLLKILSRITEPTTGRIRLRGRVASLLEVGTGFHPELTGRENIFLNGAILGMSRVEIKSKFDEIVAFAGIERFLDTPVKRYSSGMYVRLAFAVAAHLEPEILIVDEVLAVGDAEFQKKCLARMHEIAHSHGRTILFVSHNMAAVQNLCSRAVLLHKGEVQLVDTPANAIRHYVDAVMPSDVSAGLRTGTNRSGNGTIRLTGFHIEDPSGDPIQCAISGKDLVFVLAYEVAAGATPRKVDVGISIASDADQLLFVHYSSYSGVYLDPDTRTGFFRFRVSKLPLSAGRYFVGARIVVDQEEADWPKDGVGNLDVERGDFYGTGSSGFSGPTPFMVDGEWEVTSSKPVALSTGK
jgi:lipopolysaccharide transport system ATP-binding protein